MYEYITIYISFPLSSCSNVVECMGYLDTLIVDVLGGEWKRLVFCVLDYWGRWPHQIVKGGLR